MRAFKMAIILLIFLASPLVAENNVEFDLSFLVRRDGVVSSVLDLPGPYRGGSDKFRLVLHPRDPAYYYIIVDEAGLGLKLLYPAPDELGKAVGRAELHPSFPNDDSWFALDRSPGDERFFVLATARENPSLVGALRANESSPGTASRLRVLEALRRMTQASSSLRAPSVAPISLLGPIRSGGAVSDDLAMRVSAEGEYVGEFELHH
ncbi:MAG TPA: hypothetical protein VMV83_16885 [Rectinemataceae bacterium]|nr:hypothetical protein [Rectinemataceae bacterium]